MKKMILSAVATLMLATSCLAPAGPAVLPTEGALMRQVARVVERHDAYVTGDVNLDEETRTEYLSESRNVVQLMVSMPEGIPAYMLQPRLVPVLDRHDSYVDSDLSLELLTRDTYLASSSGLRSLLTSAVQSR